MTSGNTDFAELLRAMRGFLKENDMMAYLAMMAVRLIELHRVLKSTGSLYLQCDPTASHYLKLLLDGVFGKECFVNEIIWNHQQFDRGSYYFGEGGAVRWRGDAERFGGRDGTGESLTPCQARGDEKGWGNALMGRPWF
jgi:DNA methylase